MLPVDGEFILSIAPRFRGRNARKQAKIVGAISDTFADTLHAYDIDTNLRIAHFMAQVTHECAGFRTTEEFASGAAYEYRSDLGNVRPGDGRRYKGRGLIQLTGRANYRRIGTKLGLPLEDQPRLAGEPVIALRIACEYWRMRNINAAADRDDLHRATRLVNGGLNGLEDRRIYLWKAKNAVAKLEAEELAKRQKTNAVLRRGSRGDDVRQLQELLVENGYAFSVDGHFGSGTELSVKIFQKQNNLYVDGVVGRRTWQLLRRGRR